MESHIVAYWNLRSIKGDAVKAPAKAGMEYVVKVHYRVRSSDPLLYAAKKAIGPLKLSA